jgi:hypothetical protein
MLAGASRHCLCRAAVRFLEEGESFDPATGVLHERSTVRGLMVKSGN